MDLDASSTQLQQLLCQEYQQTCMKGILSLSNLMVLQHFGANQCSNSSMSLSQAQSFVLQDTHKGIVLRTAFHCFSTVSRNESLGFVCLDSSCSVKSFKAFSRWFLG